MQGLFCFILEPVLLSVLFVRLQYALYSGCPLWTVGLDPTNKEAEIVTHDLRGTAFGGELVEVGLFCFFRFHNVTIPQINRNASFILLFFHFIMVSLLSAPATSPKR